jgi:hypothetical protein
MAHLVDACILKAVEAAKGIDFEDEEMAEERLRLPARMNGGGIKKQTNMRRPAFLGALLDMLPRCVGITEVNGIVQRDYYTKQLQTKIGEGAYKHDGHRNRGFLDSTRLGPYPAACKKALEHLRMDTAYNFGLNILSTLEEWGRLGPLAQPTPEYVMNIGALERKKEQQEPAPHKTDFFATATTTAATDSTTPTSAPAATAGNTTTTVTTAPYYMNTTHPLLRLTSSATQQKASQWAPSNIADLEETNEHSGEYGDLAEAIAFTLEEAYADLRRSENS